MTEYIFPCRCEFSRKDIMENATYKVIIDFRENIITSKSIYRDSSKAVISDYVFEENSIETDRQQLFDLLKCLNLDKVNLFLNILPRDKLEEIGYREYTGVDYVIDYGNDVIFNGSLREIYKNSPFEEAIAVLRDKFDYVKNVEHF